MFFKVATTWRKLNQDPINPCRNRSDTHTNQPRANYFAHAPHNFLQIPVGNDWLKQKSGFSLIVVEDNSS